MPHHALGGPPCSRLARSPSAWLAIKRRWRSPLWLKNPTLRFSPAAPLARASAISTNASGRCHPQAHLWSWSPKRDPGGTGAPALGPPTARSAGWWPPRCSPRRPAIGAHPPGVTRSRWPDCCAQEPSPRSTAPGWRMQPSETAAARGKRPSTLSPRPNFGAQRCCCGRISAIQAEPPGGPPPAPHLVCSRQTSARSLPTSTG